MRIGPAMSKRFASKSWFVIAVAFLYSIAANSNGQADPTERRADRTAPDTSHLMDRNRPGTPRARSVGELEADHARHDHRQEQHLQRRHRLGARGHRVDD